MNQFLKNNLNNRKRELFKRLIARSQRAVCGATEREAVIPKAQLPAAMAAIRRAGKIFVGFGPAGPGRVKIWWASTALF